MLSIGLRYGVGGRRRALLRPPNGADELAIHGSGYRDAVALVAALAVEGPDTPVASDLFDLPVCDMDVVIAHLYRDLFGDVAEARCTCAVCGKPFEFELPVAPMCNAAPVTHQGVERTGEMKFRLAGGTVLRLPVVRDLFVAPQHRNDDLHSRLVIGPGEDAAEAVDAALARLTPAALDAVDTRCASCGAAQTVEFDLASFLMKCLARERDFVMREVHIIARAYGWSLSEILSLTRPLRHGFVRLAGGAVARAAVRSAA